MAAMKSRKVRQNQRLKNILCVPTTVYPRMYAAADSYMKAPSLRRGAAWHVCQPPGIMLSLKCPLPAVDFLFRGNDVSGVMISSVIILLVNSLFRGYDGVSAV